MAKDHNIVYPEYLDADTPDEIVKAVRQNVLFGAKVIKICVDCKPYGYTADEIRLVIKEAAKAGLKVEGHVQTLNGARNAIEAGIWSIAHGTALTDEMHKLMAQKGVWRAGTETPSGLAGHPVSDEAYKRTVAGLKNAYDNKVPLTFSTDADYWVEGMTRGELCLEFIKTWKDAGIPNVDTLRAMTINGYKVSETEKTRGPIKAGFFADIIAMPGNPLDDLEALKNVRFVMKDGQVFKRDGVMTPAAFFHAGPVNGWRIR
jgi:imidazolonepropionase-like amidohydrolase